MQDRFNYLYDRLQGFILEEESGSVPNLFAEGAECDKLYGLIYNARIRITKELDGTGDGENADVMIIVEALEKIGKMIAKRAYIYGVQDGLAIKNFEQ